MTDDKTLRWLNLANGDLKAAELIFLYGKEDIDVRGMTAYAVEARYPEEFFTPTKEEAQKAFLKAKAVKSFTLNRLNTSETNLTLF